MVDEKKSLFTGGQKTGEEILQREELIEAQKSGKKLDEMLNKLGEGASLSTEQKKTLSDIFGGLVTTDFAGKKERKIGFTLRVGGGRSPIMDRRNWDGYIVNKKEVRIKPKQGLEMMGFPKSFKMPVSDNQALKQLGNSVAVNVVKEIGKKIAQDLNKFSKK